MEETHETLEGYCCACEYDIACMEEKIKEAGSKIANQNFEHGELAERERFDERIAKHHDAGFREGLNRAIEILEYAKVKIDCTIEAVGYHDKNCTGCDYNRALESAITKIKEI